MPFENLFPVRLHLVALSMLLPLAGLSTNSLAQQTTPAQDAILREQLSIKAFEIQTLAIPAELNRPFTISFEMDGEPIDLDLAPHSVRGDRFSVFERDAAGAITEIQLPPETTYRGRVRQIPGSMAAASIIEGRLRVLVLMDESFIVVQPLSELLPDAPADQYVVFRDTDEMPGTHRCGTNLLGAVFVIERAAKRIALGSACSKVAEIAFDADVEFYNLNGSSIPTTVADIESIVNAMNVIYERDVNITHDITRIIVQTSEPDQYDSPDPGVLLDEFRSLWITDHAPGSPDPVQRDIAHLMTGRNLAGGVIGVAWVGTVCDSLTTGLGYALSQSRFSADFADRVSLTAHEVGHNWNALHCDGDADCAIMCASLGGCTGFNDRFGLTTISAISTFRDAIINCLGIEAPLPADDCNSNCILDTEDLASGTSKDCNSNGIPDECDISSGLSGDCNYNGVPDSCEDCDGNGLADECDLFLLHNDISGPISPLDSSSAASYVLVSPPFAIGDVRFLFTASADLATTDRKVLVTLNGTLIGELFRNYGTQCGDPVDDQDQIIMSKSNYNFLVGFGNATILMTASSSNPAVCGPTSFINLDLEYQIQSPLDFNGNGILDICECNADCASAGADGFVNVTDLLELLGNWGSSGSCDIAPPGGDGTVNVTDLLELLGSWGSCAP